MTMVLPGKSEAVAAGTHTPDLAHFIAELIRQEKPKIIQFTLCIADDQGGTTAGIANKPIDKKIEPKKIEEVADSYAEYFYRSARSEVDCGAVPMKFTLVAYSANPRDPCEARKSFRLHPPLGNQIQAGDEPANALGLVSHSMRWGDAALRLLVSGNRQQIEDYREDIENYRKHNKELLEERLIMLKEIETYRTQQLDRELAVKREQRQDDRIEKLWGMFEKMALLAAQKYGLSVSPAGAVEKPASAAMSPVQGFVHLFTTLKDEQKLTILNTLDDEQRTLFYESMQGFIAMAAAEKGQLKKAS